MSADELEASLALEKWEAAQPTTPTIFQVIEAGDIGVLGAYILRGFREAAQGAVRERQRVIELREFAYLAFGASTAAENFLRAPDPCLKGQTPLQAAVESADGRDEAILRLAPRLRRAAVEIADRLVRSWALSEVELSQLLGAEQPEVRRWQREPNQMPTFAVDRLSRLLGISRAIRTLLPSGIAGKEWIRQPLAEQPFVGGSLLSLMLEQGSQGLDQVRRYLDDRLNNWTRVGVDVAAPQLRRPNGT